ncbi:MAG: hypothetical protein PHI48_04205 [Bacteroidales bacterium]|nr:hypothetical protein [Bacteroidales bacterium]MDD4821743.1 hypothetical protein [Bacteroidales bacterium]
MKKINLVLAFMLLGSQVLLALPTKKIVASTWTTATAAYKAELLAKQKAVGFPIESGKVKKGELKKITAKVTGLDYIVLVVAAERGEKKCNDAIWAHAKVYKKDGNAVNVCDLKISGQAKLNKNSADHEVLIHQNKVSNSILSSTANYIYVPLDKKFVRFESEIGIDDESKDSTAIFRIQSESGQKEFDELSERFPEECNAFFSLCPTTGPCWLSNGTANEDAVIIKSLLSRSKEKTYFEDELAKIATLPAAQQMEASLALFSDLSDVLKIQMEVDWINIEAIQLAFNDMKKNPAFNATLYQEKLSQLTSLMKTGFDGLSNNMKEAKANARKAIALKKEILFANPLFDMDKIVVGKYKVGYNARSVNVSSLGTEPANWCCLMSASRKNFKAEIAELSNLRGEIRSKTIFKAENNSSLPHIRINWNADHIMFTMANANGLWQVYEVDIEGKNLRQVIKSPERDLEFFDATYLPNGKIIAVSNIGYLGVPCVDGNDIVGNMVLYDQQTGNLRRITFDQESNWGPIVMNNGRVMYTRWEYTDLTHYFSRIVMHMNPDGTEQKALYGSGSYFPNSTFDIKPLPGNGTRFVGIISGHHGVVRAGRMLIFDPSVSRKNADGIVHEFPYRNRKVEPIIKDELVNGVWPEFVKPYPLNESYYLVTAKLTPDGLWGIYLVDTFDNLTLLKEAEGEGYIHATPVVKTAVPPIIPEKIKL